MFPFWLGRDSLLSPAMADHDLMQMGYQLREAFDEIHLSVQAVAEPENWHWGYFFFFL